MGYSYERAIVEPVPPWVAPGSFDFLEFFKPRRLVYA